MATYSHLATVRYLQGQGNAALYVRLRNGAGEYYDFVSGLWDLEELTDNRVFLTEVDDASSVESRYNATVTLPEVNATTVLEYVRMADAMVLAEEGLPARSAVAVGPAGGTALASVAALKEYLESKVTTDDNLFARLLVAASSWFESHTGRNFTLQAYAKPFIGDGGQVFVPPQFPLVSVSAVTVNGNAVPAAVAATDQGWRIVDNTVQLVGYVFSKGYLCQVDYSAGYAQVPADVEQAVIELAADRYRYRKRIGQTSSSVGGESMSFVPSTIPLSVQGVVDVYRNLTA